MLAVVAVVGVTLQSLGPPPPVPSVQPVAAVQPSNLPVAWNGRIVAPDSALLEPSKAYSPAALPRIAADGRLPRQVYRRPLTTAATRPRIALIVAGLGLSAADSRAAIDAMPGAVTLAFSAYTPNPEPLMEAARARGHEILASLPMEANGYPLNDAGPKSLLTGSTPGTNRDNLEWALSRLQGYVGVTGASDGLRGERFADQTSSMTLVLEELTRRGLLYIDPRPGAAPPKAFGRAVDVVVDDPASRAEIEAKLLALERLARERGSALGLAGPLRPVTVERITAWARDAEARGFEIVPVSALVSASVSASANEPPR